jgi:hypothetical protein
VGSPEDKQKRNQRRRNHIAKDLRTRKYQSRVIPHKSKEQVHPTKITIKEIESEYDE